jgi:predicted membrane chloride channel (bestrophin family)
VDRCVSDNEWAELLNLGLLTEGEEAELKKSQHRNRSHVLLLWAGQAVIGGFERAGLNLALAKECIVKLDTVRDIQQELVDTMNLPVPYQYYHILHVMVVMNLLLWAYGMAATLSVFAPFVYFFASLIFMGMIELSKQLADPFGTDDVDFPLAAWLGSFLEHIAVTIETEDPPFIVDIDATAACEGGMKNRNYHVNLFLSENLNNDNSDVYKRLVPSPSTLSWT